MYSSSLARCSARLSLGDRSSSTKSGHRGGNLRRCISLKAFHRDLVTHARSGARSAPFGSRNPRRRVEPEPRAVALHPRRELADQVEVAATGLSSCRRPDEQLSIGGAFDPEVAVGRTELEQLVMPERSGQPEAHRQIAPARDQRHAEIILDECRRDHRGHDSTRTARSGARRRLSPSTLKRLAAAPHWIQRTLGSQARRQPPGSFSRSARSSCAGGARSDPKRRVL